MHTQARVSSTFVRLSSVLLLALILLLYRVTVQSDNLTSIAITADNASQIAPLASLPMMPITRLSTFSQVGMIVSAHALSYPQFITRLWDLSTLAVTDLPQGRPLAINSTGSRVVIENSVTIARTQWVDVPSGQTHLLMQGSADNAVFSPNDEWLITLMTSGTGSATLQLWDGQRGTEQAVFSSDSYVLSVFSPDSREIVLFTLEHTVQLWDIATQSVRLTLPVYADGAIYYAGGARLITYGRTGFDLWNTNMGDNLAHRDYQFAARGRGITAELSPDEAALLIRTANDNYHVAAELWQISDPTDLRMLPLPDHDHDMVAAFSRDSRFLAVASDSVEGVDLFSVQTGAQIAHLDEQIGSSYYQTQTRYLAFNSAGDVLITGSAESMIRLWRWDGHDLSLITELPGDGFYLTPDSTTLITLLDSRVLMAYGVPSPERPQQQLVVPAHIVPSAINVRAAPDRDAAVIGQVSGDVLISGRSGDYLAVPAAGGWVRSDPLYIQLADGFPSALLPEMNRAAPIEIPPTATPTLPYPTRTPIPPPLPTLAADHASPLTAADLVVPPVSPLDGITAITAAAAADIRLLGLLPSGTNPYSDIHLTPSHNGAQVFIPAFNTYPSSNSLPGRVWSLTDLHLLAELPRVERGISTASAEGDLIAYQGWGEALTHLWSAANGEAREIGTLSMSETTQTGALIFSLDGSRLISAGYNNPTQVWDTATLTEQYALLSAENLYITPDSQILLISTPYEDIIRGFDVETGDPLFRLEVPSSYRLDVSLSPDNRHMAIANRDGLRVWTLDGTLLWQVQGSFVDAVFHPGGRLLATTEDGNVLRLWNVDTGEMIATYAADAEAGMAFSPDGSLLVVGNPLRFIDLQTGTITQPAMSYAVDDPLFSPDGGTLLINGLGSTMVFGVPTEQRPEWQPITGRIIPSGVNVRALPGIDSAVIGYASGEVRIGGRALTAQAVYLPDAGGWVWSDPEYLDLGDHDLSELPVIYTGTEE